MLAPRNLLPDHMENNTHSKTTVSSYGQIISTRKLAKAVIYLALVSIFTYSAFFPLKEEIQLFVFSLFSIPYLVLSLIWIYKTNRNSHAAGATGMTFSTKWVCALVLIPIVNYFVMQELWKTSINPANWKNESGSLRLIWFLITDIISLVIMMPFFFTDASYITILNVLSDVAGTLSTLLLLSVIFRISSSQEALINRVVS